MYIHLLVCMYLVFIDPEVDLLAPAACCLGLRADNTYCLRPPKKHTHTHKSSNPYIALIRKNNSQYSPHSPYKEDVLFFVFFAGS